MANPPQDAPIMKPTSLLCNPPEGYHRFRSREEFQWWEASFQNRAVVMERPVLIGTLDDFPQRNSFETHQGWVDYLRRQGNSCNFTICHEFIASLLPIPNVDSSFMARVRGVDVPFNLQIVSEAMGIPALPERGYDIPTWDRRRLPNRV